MRHQLNMVRAALQLFKLPVDARLGKGVDPDPIMDLPQQCLTEIAAALHEGDEVAVTAELARLIRQALQIAATYDLPVCEAFDEIHLAAVQRSRVEDIKNVVKRYRARTLTVPPHIIEERGPQKRKKRP
jgi:hypothetical protein